MSDERQLLIIRDGRDVSFGAGSKLRFSIVVLMLTVFMLFHRMFVLELISSFMNKSGGEVWGARQNTRTNTYDRSTNISGCNGLFQCAHDFCSSNERADIVIYYPMDAFPVNISMGSIVRELWSWPSLQSIGILIGLSVFILSLGLVIAQRVTSGRAKNILIILYFIVRSGIPVAYVLNKIGDEQSGMSTYSHLPQSVVIYGEVEIALVILMYLVEVAVYLNFCQGALIDHYVGYTTSIVITILAVFALSSQIMLQTHIFLLFPSNVSLFDMEHISKGGVWETFRIINGSARECYGTFDCVSVMGSNFSTIGIMFGDHVQCDHGLWAVVVSLLTNQGILQAACVIAMILAAIVSITSASIYLKVGQSQRMGMTLSGIYLFSVFCTPLTYVLNTMILSAIKNNAPEYLIGLEWISMTVMVAVFTAGIMPWYNMNQKEMLRPEIDQSIN